jgi:Protein of unknown function (DUF4058)
MNRFPGVNPNLNSLLQTRGTDEQPSVWPAFHSAHVNHIADFLNEKLPGNYTAYSEQALQVRGVDWGGDIVLNRPRPDVSIFQQRPSTESPALSSVVSSPTWEATIATVIEPLKRLIGVVIRVVEGDATLGRVVTRIELLSPSNKPGGSDASAYDDKRIETLEEGIPLIEIDYLHETPPVIHTIPVYPDDPGAYPYMIAVSDPRPTWDIGKVTVYGFGVRDVLPTILIPLLNDERIAFDFNAVYQHTFVARRFHNLINYGDEPARFHTYSSADQAYIRERVAEEG